MVCDSALAEPLTIDADAAVASALARREELGQAAELERAAVQGRRVAIGSLMPNIALAVDYGVQDRPSPLPTGRDFWSASLVMSWNVLAGGRDAARRDEAGADVLRARAARAELADRIELDVRTAHEAARVAGEAIATAGARLDAARQAFVLVQRRYEAGVASPIELTDARTSLTNAELNRIVTGYRYAIRLADLQR